MPIFDPFRRAAEQRDSALHHHLATQPIFAGLDPALLTQLEESLSLVKLAAGEALVRQGEAADALYVLISGRLDVMVRTESGGELRVDQLEPGASVGEMALVTGQERTATVTAAQRSELVRLAREGFEQLAERHPEVREAVIREMEPRLQRVQLSGMLEDWFPDMGHTQVRELQDALEWVHLAGGEQLYRQGEQADGMYLLVSGRLRTQTEHPDGTSVQVAEIGRGASIGEYAVLGEAPRTETVTAIRDSQVVRLTREQVAGNPQVMAQIARNALERAQATGPKRVGAGNGVRTIALVAAHEGAPVESVRRVLNEQLTAWGRVASIDSGIVDARFARKGAAQTVQGDALWSALTWWLNEAETAFEYTLLLADPALTPWTLRCVNQADQVVVVADAGSDHRPGQVELGMAGRPSGRLNLVLVHPDEAERPQGTARWLDARPPLEHHHLRLGLPLDGGRLARRLTGRAVGLALSGGGARGYVHIGLIRALEELGQPVDMVVGTSMGALVGAAYAVSLSYEFCLRTAKTFGDPKKLLDKTLPLVAIAESRNVTEVFTGLFGDTRLEDFWIPYRCVSANLTRADLVVHERGRAWEAIRASTAIPGVFTPMIVDGDVLVDGGIMNNYPVDIGREMIGTGLVIGSNAESANRNRAFDFGPSVSGWRVLLERLLPGGRRARYPSILGTLMRSTSVSSKYLGAAADVLADIAIRYPAQDYGNLEFDRHGELIEIGYATAMERLRAWKHLPVRSSWEGDQERAGLPEASGQAR